MLQKVTEAEHLMAEVRGLLPLVDIEKKFMSEILMWEMEAVEVLLDKKEVKHLKSVQVALQARIEMISESGGPVISDKWSSFHIDEDEKKQNMASPSRMKNIPILSSCSTNREILFSPLFCIFALVGGCP